MSSPTCATPPPVRSRSWSATARSSTTTRSWPPGCSGRPPRRPGRLIHVVPPRSARDLEGPGRRQHRPLRLRQPGPSRHRDDHRQLHPARGAGRRPELLRVRRRRALRDRHRQRRRRRRRHHLPVPLPHPRPERRDVPLQHRARSAPSTAPAGTGPRPTPSPASTSGHGQGPRLQPGLPAGQHRPALHAELRGACAQAAVHNLQRRHQGLRRPAPRGLLRRPRLDLRPGRPAAVPATCTSSRPRPRPASTRPDLNVHTIAMQVPITS